MKKAPSGSRTKSFETLRRVERHDPAVADHRDAIAQPLRFLHEMRREQHGHAAVAHRAHEIPDAAACLRIEPGRELVEEHDLGFVDQRQCDERTLLLPAGQVPEGDVRAVRETELREDVGRAAPLAMEGREEVERLPEPQAVRQRRALQLHADARSQRAAVARRVEAEDAELARIRTA